MVGLVAKYQRYAEYKDSGVEWLGEIPSHWGTCSISKLFTIKAGGDVDLKNFSEDRLEEYPYPIYTNANDKNSIYGYSKVANYQANSITVSGRGEVGFSVYRDHPFEAIIRLLVLTPQKKCYPKFYAYYINEVINFRVESSAIGQLSTLQIAPYKTVLPSIDEQKLISNFLDHETAKIDSLIEKQQQLIQLLKEKRQAVISHAVTKGLDPRVNMKDSGVEWLGEVPEHWNTLPLKLCVQTRKGVAFKAVDFCDAGIRVVKASDIKQKTIRESETFLPNSYVNEFPKAVLHTDDLILSTVGSTPDVKNSAVGQIGKVPQSLSGSLLNQNTVVFSSTEILDQNFLYYLVQTNSYRDHLDLNAHGTANQASLNISDMLNFMISIPELNEQVEIKNYLDKKISKVEELELKILAMSISLNERRTALISAAVTGKIDVRNWQNPTEAKMEFSA